MQGSASHTIERGIDGVMQLSEGVQSWLFPEALTRWLFCLQSSKKQLRMAAQGLE